MIAVFSGTSEGQTIVNELISRGYKVCCFNATKYGGTLYEKHDNLVVLDHMMAKEEIASKLVYYNINTIIDATHPYAKIISRNLIEISKEMKFTYLRFERSLGNFCEALYDSYNDIISELEKKEGNILLTIGSNNLELFTSVLSLERLYSRVLPTEKVIKKCFELGLSPKTIIGVQGPFSKLMNYAMMKEYDIKYLVTKDSGEAGGFDEKIEAASELNIQVLILKRPDIGYPNSYNTITDLLKKIEE